MTARLLFADSDRQLLELYDRFFSNLGFQVETAADVAECVRRANRRTPDLLVIERELPPVGAEAALAALRSLRGPDAVVCLLSTSRPDDSQRDPLDDCQSRPLVKPFRLSDLLRRIQAELAGTTAAVTTISTR